MQRDMARERDTVEHLREKVQGLEDALAQAPPSPGRAGGRGERSRSQLLQMYSASRHRSSAFKMLAVKC